MAWTETWITDCSCDPGIESCFLGSLYLKRTMIRATWSSSASRTAVESGTQLSRNFPELFLSQRQAAHAASQAQTPSSPNVTAGSHSAEAMLTDSGASQEQLPSLLDLEKFALDIKNTVTATIADLKTDIQVVTHRIDNVEQTTQTHVAAIRQVQTAYDTQLSQIFKIHRQVEHLDNRGRRHNIRVRGSLRAQTRELYSRPSAQYSTI